MYCLGCIYETKGEIKRAYDLYAEAAKLGNRFSIAKLEAEYIIISGAGVVKEKDRIRIRSLLNRCNTAERDQYIKDLYKCEMILEFDDDNISYAKFVKFEL